MKILNNVPKPLLFTHKYVTLFLKNKFKTPFHPSNHRQSNSIMRDINIHTRDGHVPERKR